MARLNYRLICPARFFFVFIALFGVHLIDNSGSAFAAQFVPIPSLDAIAYSNAATGVSQNGRIVVGWSDSDDGKRAFRWTVEDGAQSLGVGYMPGSMDRVSQATAISADGSVIVGWTHYFDTISWSARQMAFIWTAEGGFHIIPASNGNSYIPNALSADGSVIVGDVTTGTFSKFAVIFHWDDTVETLLGGGYPWSQAQAVGVSHDGSRITGSGVYTSSSCNPRVTFLHDEATGFQFIGEFTSDAFTSAKAISADGRLIAGTLGATDSSVFRWSESTGLIDAGTLTGALNTEILAVNETGDIMVGRAGTINNWSAFIWDQTVGYQLLADYAAQTLALDLQGWQLTQAKAVTQYAIVGEGVDPDGRQKAWMILLDIFGDDDNDGDVDGHDLYAYATAANLSSIAGFAGTYGR